MPAHRAPDLSESFTGFMTSAKLITLVLVELVILLSYLNSGIYRCYTWNVNSGGAEVRWSPKIGQVFKVYSTG